ncbi:phage portal protein family protein [Pseudostreptobacillus hongkongensis]|uniref:phage portal protein family protein n=1 Tax=Pseudostreptobacillus hongkongensis TaxID=1162717 RepID=UPI00083793E0|nr:DUF935 family protein [Pseudostreptobacillus hongkongensis]
MKLDKKLLELTVNQLINTEVKSNYNVELTDDLIEEMCNDVTIKMCIDTLVKGVSSRELVVKSEDNAEQDEKIIEIQKRINKIRNKTRLVEDIAMAYFKKLSLHEIVYNDKLDGIKELVEIPKKLVKYNRDNKIFTLTVDNTVYDLSEKNKWLLSIHGKSIAYRQGRSKLESCVTDYLNIRNINEKIQGIVNKYGDTIMVFAYSPEQSEKEVENTAEDIKKANGKNVIAIPISENTTLKENLFTIRLSDIDTVIHERLLDRYKKNIVMNLLGSSLTVDNGGGSSSYALGNIHQEEKEKIEDSLALFVRDELDKLIDIDAELYGYDSELYYISIDRPENESERLEIDTKRQDFKQKVINGVLTLSQAGYEIDEEELKELTGFSTVRKKENTTF